MDCRIQQDLRITQGKTFMRVVYWSTEPLLYAGITGITQAAPVEITAPDHGIPDGWDAAIVSVGGMREINTRGSLADRENFHRTYVTGPNTIEFPDINSAEFKPYTTGGYLAYYTPVDILNFTARMQIKDRVGGTVLMSLTDTDGITIDSTGRKITFQIDADTTAAFDWVRGVYDFEMVSPDGVVTALLYGAVHVSKEVTTPT